MSSFPYHGLFAFAAFLFLHTVTPLFAQSKAELEVFRLVNQERAKKKRPPLVWDESLARAARYHAADMAKDGYFKHASFDRKNGKLVRVERTFERIARFAKNPRAENIAVGQISPRQVMAGWMKSRSHRNNILSPFSTRIGVAFVKGYWVQDFGK
ncbi:MAG: CAP domain-containing protein [Chthoniobacterales bacterium]